jgi:ubiquinone/menaquinone biosynthesis C-methylase UbiE
MIMNQTIRQQNERAIWDQIANRYDSNVMETFAKAYRLTQEAIMEEVNNRSRVLEVGCGTGIISLAIVPHAGEVVGVDLSPKMITLAQEKAKNEGLQNLNFREADAYELPFEDERFDLVLLTNLLHFVADPTKVLKEARRVLRSGGVLATVTDCMAEPAPLRVRLHTFGLRMMKLIGKIKYFHFFHRRDLNDLLESSGFKIKQEADFHDTPVNYYLSGVKNG